MELQIARQKFASESLHLLMAIANGTTRSAISRTYSVVTCPLSSLQNSAIGRTFLIAWRTTSPFDPVKTNAVEKAA